MKFGKLEDGKYFLKIGALIRDNAVINDLEKEIQEAKPKEVHLPDPMDIHYTFFKESVLVNMVLFSEKYDFRIFTSERWHNIADMLFATCLGGNQKEGFYLQIPDRSRTLTVIPEKDLIPERFYMGRGRNTNVGLWHDEVFITFCYKFEHPNQKYEGHYDDGGCFQPFQLLPALEELLSEKPTVIPKAELEDLKFYHCLGGEYNIAQWQERENEFLTWGKGKVSPVCEWTKDGPRYHGKLVDDIICTAKKYEEIKPFKKINEGEMIEPFGTLAWEGHYGKKIRMAE